MSTCAVCTHVARSMIEADLRVGIRPSHLEKLHGPHRLVIARHQRLHMAPLDMPCPACRLIAQRIPIDESDPARQVTENPLRQFNRAVKDAQSAYALAKDDQRLQAHMRDVLNQAFQSDE